MLKFVISWYIIKAIVSIVSKNSIFPSIIDVAKKNLTELRFLSISIDHLQFEY